MARAMELGMVGLRTPVTFHVELEAGRRPRPMGFVVDSGSSYSIMSLEAAREYLIATGPLGPETVLDATTADGRSSFRVRPGRVRLWWHERLLGYPFDWPMLFRVDAPIGVPAILGLGGVVKTCRWTFDGGYATDSPFGSLTLEDTR